DDTLVRLARADNPAMGPNRSPPPLPFFSDLRIRLFDELAYPTQYVSAPVTELRNSLGDPFRRGLFVSFPRALHHPRTSCEHKTSAAEPFIAVPSFSFPSPTKVC